MLMRQPISSNAANQFLSLTKCTSLDKEFDKGLPRHVCLAFLWLVHWTCWVGHQQPVLCCCQGSEAVGKLGHRPVYATGLGGHVQIPAPDDLVRIHGVYVPIQSQIEHVLCYPVKMCDKSTFIWHILTQHVHKSTHLLGILFQLSITCMYLCVPIDMYLGAFVSKLLHIKIVSQTCKTGAFTNCYTVLAPDRSTFQLPPE